MGLSVVLQGVNYHYGLLDIDQQILPVLVGRFVGRFVRRLYIVVLFVRDVLYFTLVPLESNLSFFDTLYQVSFYLMYI
jgi:hypothetical protein